MSRLVRRRIARADWTEDHFLQLLWGHDFPHAAWLELYTLTEDELREAVAEMAECWARHEDEVRALGELNRHRGEPWFAQYADDPDRLIEEELAKENRPWHMKIRAQQEAQQNT